MTHKFESSEQKVEAIWLHQTATVDSVGRPRRRPPVTRLPARTVCWHRIVISMAAFLLVAGARPGNAQEGSDQFFDSDGVRIRYTVSGQGPPVLLLHGFGGSLDDWSAIPLMSEISESFQLIAMDVRGHGGSDKPHDPAAYGADVVDDVTRLLDRLGIASAHVVGYSMGARMTIKLALSHQDRLLSAVLVGSGVTLPEDFPLYTEGAQALEGGTLDVGDNDAAALAAMLRAVESWAVVEQDVSPLQVPILVVAGAADVNLPGVELLARLLPSVELVVVPGHDHASILASEELTLVTRDFLHEFGAR